MLQSSTAISNMHISNLFSSPARLNYCSNLNCNKEESWELLKKLCLSTLRRIFSLKFKSRMPMFFQKLWTNCSKSSNRFKWFIQWGNFNAVTCFFQLDSWQRTLGILLKSKYFFLFFSRSNNSSYSIASFIYYFFIFDSILTKMTQSRNHTKIT